MKAKIKLGGDHYLEGHSVIEISLKEKEKGLCFSASGLYNYTYDEYIDDWDYQRAGQCIETIAKDYPNNKDVQTILSLWKKHHLNDMNAGTPMQTKYLKSLGEYQSYEWACEQLQRANIYYDNNYKYGTSWLYREIPEKDVQQIKELITKYQNK